MDPNDDTHSFTSALTLVETESQLSDPEEESSAHSKPTRFIFKRIAPMRVNMEVYSSRDKKNPIYFLNISGSFSDDSAITMHNGANKRDPVLGTCHFTKLRATKFELQPQTGPKSTMLLSQQDRCYFWTVPWDIEERSQSPWHERHFLWKRGEEQPWGTPGAGNLNLELHDTESSLVHAVYKGADAGSRKGGVLKLNTDLSQKYQTMVFLTLSALIEKGRQKRDANGSFTKGLLLM